MIPSVSPEADRELTEAAVYYAREANAELGLAFIAEFERALDLLGTHPRLGAPWRRDRRRFPLRRFPYNIIYYIRGEELRVIALAHNRRRPDYWAGRVFSCSGKAIVLEGLSRLRSRSVARDEVHPLMPLTEAHGGGMTTPLVQVTSENA